MNGKFSDYSTNSKSNIKLRNLNKKLQKISPTFVTFNNSVGDLGACEQGLEEHCLEERGCMVQRDVEVADHHIHGDWDCYHGHHNESSQEEDCADKDYIFDDDDFMTTLVTCKGGWRPSGEIVTDGGGVAPAPPGVRPLLVNIGIKCKN